MRGGASYLLVSEIILLVVSVFCWYLIFLVVVFLNVDVKLFRLALSFWKNKMEGFKIE